MEASKNTVTSLFALIEHDSVPMAVVDYLGMKNHRFQTIKKDDPDRYGVRGLNHVSIYKLKVVRLNQAALDTAVK